MTTPSSPTPSAVSGSTQTSAAPSSTTSNASSSSSPGTSSAPTQSGGSGSPNRAPNGQFASHPGGVKGPAAEGKIPPPVSLEDEVAEVLADGADSEAPAGETAAEKKRRLHKIKVFGKEEEVDLDSLSDEDYVRYIQKGKAADIQMQEAARIRKEWEEVRKFIKENPFEALKHEAFGLDLDKLAEERLAQKYQEMTLPEAEREKLELKRKLEAYEKREQEFRLQQERAQQEALQKQVYEETQNLFHQALNSEGIPQTRETMFMMAEVARHGLDAGIEYTPQQLAAEVKRKMGDLHTRFVTNLKGEALVKYLGDSVVKEVLAHAVQQAKAKRKPNVAPPVEEQKVDDVEAKPQRKMQDYSKVREFFRK